MKKFEIARLAGAVAGVSNNGLEPKKGLKLYRFYQALKAVQSEVSEFEQKLRTDFDIKEQDNDPEALKKYNEAFLEMLNEDVTLDVDAFLTEDEAIEVFGKVLTMEGLNIILPMVATDSDERFQKTLKNVREVAATNDEFYSQMEAERNK